MQVADALRDLEGAGEVRLGLAGEAADDVGGERRRQVVGGERRVDLVDHRQVVLGVVLAVHRAEDSARPGLQRQMKVPVWGWAKPSSKVTVTFAGQEKSATADATFPAR